MSQSKKLRNAAAFAFVSLLFTPGCTKVVYVTTTEAPIVTDAPTTTAPSNTDAPTTTAMVVTDSSDYFVFGYLIKPYADLRGAFFNGADLSGVDLEGADLSGADLRGANLRDANLYQANLEGANLNQADLSGANLEDANLSRANLQNAKLTNADLPFASLEGANLLGADLTGANLNRVHLAGATMPDGTKQDLTIGSTIQIPEDLTVLSTQELNALHDEIVAALAELDALGSRDDDEVGQTWRLEEALNNVVIEQNRRGR